MHVPRAAHLHEKCIERNSNTHVSMQRGTGIGEVATEGPTKCTISDGACGQALVFCL